MTDKRADGDPGADSSGGGAPSPFDQATEEIPAQGGAGGGRRPYREWEQGGAASAGPASAGSTSRWSRLGHPVQTARFTPGPRQGGAGEPVYSEVVDEDDLAFGGATEQLPQVPRQAPAGGAATEAAPVVDEATGPLPSPAPQDNRTEVLARPAAPELGAPYSGAPDSAAPLNVSKTDPVPLAGAPTTAFEPLSVPAGGPGGPVEYGGAALGTSTGEDTAWSYAPAYAPPPVAGHAAPQQAPQEAPPEYAAQPQGRGTLDLGLLLLRLVVGGLLVVDGLRNTLGLVGGPGLSGLESVLAGWGFEYARAVSIGLVSVQLGAGVLIIVGLATPLAASVVVAAMLNLTLGQHLGGGPVLVFSPGVDELPLIVGATAAALALTGPGRIGLDGPMRWSTRPRFGSFALLFLGLVGGLAGWLFLSGTLGG